MSGEPIAWVAGPLQGDPTNAMEHDVAKFEECVKNARANFGTDDFWTYHRQARSLWRKWWYKNLGLMRAEKMDSLLRTHFNARYMPEDSAASLMFWQVYEQVEDLMYPDRAKKEPPRDNGMIGALIDHLYVLNDMSQRRSGRSICDIRVITVLKQQHEAEMRKEERRKTRPTFRVLGPILRPPATLKKTGS